MILFAAREKQEMSDSYLSDGKKKEGLERRVAGEVRKKKDEYSYRISYLPLKKISESTGGSKKGTLEKKCAKKRADTKEAGVEGRRYASYSSKSVSVDARLSSGQKEKVPQLNKRKNRERSSKARRLVDKRKDISASKKVEASVGKRGEGKTRKGLKRRVCPKKKLAPDGRISFGGKATYKGS